MIVTPARCETQPPPRAAPPVAPAPGDEATAAPPGDLVCATCARRITHDDHRIAVNGAHEHTFVNPGGFVHVVGCFAAASGLAYVVVQHLDPTHKAFLSELLQRATAMPVLEASEGLRIQADHVYVIPPNVELTVSRGALHLSGPSQRRGMRLPIDVLFSSLARELGDRAIGVILSGMGSDGSLGLQAIKAQGGLSAVQLPESA